MELVPWGPLRSFSALREEVDKIFDEFFGRLPKRREEVLRWGPSADVYETKDEIVVELELPGVKKEDFSLHVTEDTLTIKGERKMKKELKEENYYYRERSWGMFQRTINLPVEIIPDKAKATYKEGVLEIRLPKAKAPSRGVKIEIE